jgi:hypothetical protein
LYILGIGVAEQTKIVEINALQLPQIEGFNRGI